VAEPDKRRSAKAEPPEGSEDWPTLGEVAKTLGLTRSKVSTLVANGRLKKYTTPNSKGGSGIPAWRFDPEDVDALEDELVEEKESAATPTSADVVRASVEGLKAAQSHAERLVALFEEPYGFVLQTLREENAAMRLELQTMRAERVALEAQREEWRSTRAVEAIVVQEASDAAATKREAIELAKKVGLHFLNQQALKNGVDPKLIMLRDAVASIPRESIEVAFAMGVIPPEAEAKLKAALDWVDAPTTEPNGAAS
jgi:hypothetical protein